MYGYNSYGSYTPTNNSSTSWGRHGNDRRFWDSAVCLSWRNWYASWFHFLNRFFLHFLMVISLPLQIWCSVFSGYCKFSLQIPKFLHTIFSAWKRKKSYNFWCLKSFSRIRFKLCVQYYVDVTHLCNQSSSLSVRHTVTLCPSHACLGNHPDQFFLDMYNYYTQC